MEKICKISNVFLNLKAMGRVAASRLDGDGEEGEGKEKSEGGRPVRRAGFGEGETNARGGMPSGRNHPPLPFRNPEGEACTEVRGEGIKKGKGHSMKKHLFSFFFGAAVLFAVAGSAFGEAIFQYWTDLYMVNLTGFDIQITNTKWKGLDTNYPYVKPGDIIIAPKDPNNPGDPTHIGKVSEYSRGVKIEIWFKLLGHEGSEDCYLYVDNPYTGSNTITPAKKFPLPQCPSMTDQGDAPLYHNIQLPPSGHKLALVAILAFQDLFGKTTVTGVDEAKSTSEFQEQVDSAESDESRFIMETGMSLPSH